MTEQVTIVIKDEFSGEVEKVHASLRRWKAEVKNKTPIGKSELQALERTCYNVGREVSSAVRALGITSAFTSGGFVAILVAIGSQLDKFASEGLKQHAMAREVGLTYEQFERFVTADMAAGATEPEARARMERFARSVRDFALGNRSSTRARLEDAAGRSSDSGAIVSRRFQETLREQGLNKTMLLYLEHMTEKARSGDQRAARILGDAVGLHGSGADEIRGQYDKLGKIATVDEAASKKFWIASRNLRISLKSLRNRVGIIMLPVFRGLLRLLAKAFSGRTSEDFKERIKKIYAALKAFNWDKLRRWVGKALTFVAKEIGDVISDLASFVDDIDKFVRMVDRWRQGNRWQAGVGKPILYFHKPGADASQFFRWPDPSEGNVMGEIPDGSGGAINISREYQRWQLENAKDLPESSNIEDRRNDPPLMDPKLERKKQLRRKTGELSIELRRFVDGMRDMRGGAGGGSSDGGVSGKNRSRPMGTKAGGAGGTPVFFGPPPGDRQVVKGSWFGQYSRGMGSQVPGGWVDPGDMDKKGRSLGNFGGYSQDTPGVAIPYKGSAGRPGQQEGQPIRVWDLGRVGPGQRSHLARQVDIGPNQATTDKGIDINAPLAERLGYAPAGKGKASGRPEFPTGQPFAYQAIGVQDMLRARQQMDVERRHASGTAVPWSRHGTLEMDVNVKGPRGISADAEVTGGDFKPADGGVTVNREISSGAEE